MMNTRATTTTRNTESFKGLKNKESERAFDRDKKSHET